LVLGDFEIIAGLQVHPKGRIVTEITRKAEGGVRGDAAAFVDDVGDASDGDAQSHCDFVHAEPQGGHELFAESLAGMHGLEFLAMVALLMVIDDCAGEKNRPEGRPLRKERGRADGHIGAFEDKREERIKQIPHFVRDDGARAGAEGHDMAR